MRKTSWMFLFAAMLLITANITLADSEFGKMADGNLKDGCVLSSSVQYEAIDVKNFEPTFSGKAGKGWQIENPEGTLAGMVVGNFKFKNEQKNYSFFRKELSDDGFVLTWRTDSEEVSLYMPWSRFSPAPKGEGILCRNHLSK